MSWTDERVDQLKNLWTEGLSASRIARALGGVTRNSVIGKVHRLGLAGRATPTCSNHPRLPSVPRQLSAKRLAKMAESLYGPPMKPFRWEPELEPIVFEDGTHVSVLAINDRMCRWPIGDPSENEFHFCGHKPKASAPYCEAHARKAYQPHESRDPNKPRRIISPSRYQGRDFEPGASKQDVTASF